jgi:type I restriction enzyme S subunit
LDLAGGALGPAIVKADCVRLRPSSDVDPVFLISALNSPRGLKRAEETAHGLGRLRINLGEMRALQVPLPPLTEQRRIVRKLTDLQERGRRAREALDSIPPLLEKLRQSILAAAFRGDLTRDWRAKHPDVEPASELLKRIRAERRKKWEDAELAKMVAKGKPPKDDRWKARYEEPKPVDPAGLPVLPEGWCWASADELLVDIEAGRSPKAEGRPAEPHEQGVLKVSAGRNSETDAVHRQFSPARIGMTLSSVVT